MEGEKRDATTTSNGDKTAASNWRTQNLSLTSRRPVRPGLIWNCATLRRQYSTHRCVHKPLHSRNHLVGTEGNIVALATSSNPDQPETRLEYQHYSSHLRESLASWKELEKTLAVRRVRQAVIKPWAQRHVMLTSNSNELKMIKPRILSTSCKCISAAQINRFCILVSNFFDRDVVLPKQMNITQTAKHPEIISHVIGMADREAFPIKTSQRNASFESDNPDGTSTPHTYRQANVSKVHFEAAESSDSQSFRHITLSEASSQDMQDCASFKKK